MSIIRLEGLPFYFDDGGKSVELEVVGMVENGAVIYAEIKCDEPGKGSIDVSWNEAICDALVDKAREDEGLVLTRERRGA